MGNELIERLKEAAETKVGLGSTRYVEHDDLNAIIEQHQQMLEALEIAADVIGAMPMGDNNTQRPEYKAHEAVCAAIAKATP